MEKMLVNVVLEGMEIHCLQMLESHLDRIKEDLKIAVTNSVKNFDFQSYVDRLVNKWIEENITEAFTNVMENQMDISDELERLVKSTIAKTITQKETDK